MSDKPICFSCVHHKQVKGHPSGYEHFCAASTSTPPSGRKYFPIKCSAHSDPAHRPAPLVEALADDTHLHCGDQPMSFTEHYPSDDEVLTNHDHPEDLEVEIRWRSGYSGGDGEKTYEILEIRTPDGRCWHKSDIEVVGDPWHPTEVVFRITYNPEGGL